MLFLCSLSSAALSHGKSMAFFVSLNWCDQWTSVPSNLIPLQNGCCRWWLQCPHPILGVSRVKLQQPSGPFAHHLNCDLLCQTLFQCQFVNALFVSFSWEVPTTLTNCNVILQRAHKNTALMCLTWCLDAIAYELLSWKPHYHSNSGPLGI